MHLRERVEAEHAEPSRHLSASQDAGVGVCILGIRRHIAERLLVLISNGHNSAIPGENDSESEIIITDGQQVIMI